MVVPQPLLPLGPPAVPPLAMPVQPAMMAVPPVPSPLAMMGGGMLSPMAALADPLVMLALLEMIASEQRETYKPVYPVWYEQHRDGFSRPKAGEVVRQARQAREDFSDLILRWQRDRRWLNQSVVGTFKGFDPETEKTFQDSSLVLDTMLVTSLLATADEMVRVRPPKKQYADDAEKIESWAVCVREADQHRHYLTHGTDLKMDEVKTALSYGHLVCRRLPNFEARSDEIPITVDLLDPATCFPTFAAGRGMIAMHRIYRQSIERIVGTWEREGNRIERKLLARPFRQASGAERDRRRGDELEVIEFWDPRWHCVVVDGEIIHAWEHDLGEVPFVYVRSPIGEPAQVSEPSLEGTATDRRRELAAKGLSHIAYMQKTHEQKEAIFGAMMTELAKVRNPSRTFEQAASVYGDTPLISNAEGAMSLLRAGEEREVPTPLAQGFQLAPPVLSAVQENAARGMMPREAYGIGTAQTSGVANEGLTESGRDKVAPWKLMLEMYRKECLDFDLRLIRNWGHLMGSEGEKGHLRYQREKPNTAGDYEDEITPEMLRQARYKTSVSLVSMRLQGDAMKAQYVQMRKSMGLMEDVDALELFGVQDAEAYLRRIDIQEFKKTDEYRLAKLIDWMRDEGESPLVIALAQQLVMQRMSGGGGGGQPGMSPQPPGIPGMAQAMGAPTGQQGGAPTGPNGPQQGGMAPPMPPPSPGGLPPGAM